VRGGARTCSFYSPGRGADAKKGRGRIFTSAPGGADTYTRPRPPGRERLYKSAPRGADSYTRPRPFFASAPLPGL